jgi:DNA-directed RNA polymerase subunit K/omega
MAMDYKKTNATTTTETRDIKKLEEGVGNVYEATVIVARRANQIAAEMKDELNTKLEEFASYTDNLEEIFENKEQIEISKFYERLPKPTLIALQEYLEGKIYFRNPKTGSENSQGPASEEQSNE